MTTRAITITFADPYGRSPLNGHTDRELREKYTEFSLDNGVSVISVEVDDLLPTPKHRAQVSA